MTETLVLHTESFPKLRPVHRRAVPGKDSEDSLGEDLSAPVSLLGGLCRDLEVDGAFVRSVQTKAYRRRS